MRDKNGLKMKNRVINVQVMCLKVHYVVSGEEIKQKCF